MTPGESDIVARLAREFDEILKEVRTDPDLGRRIARSLARIRRAQRPPSRYPHRRSPGPVDPFLLYEQGGADGLRDRLSHLGIEQLKDIVSEHGMDRHKLAMKWKTPRKLIDLIVETVAARAKKGDAFRHS